MALVLFTGATSLIVEGTAFNDPAGFFFILLGLYLTGGGANALNQCFERDIDARMNRTKKRRPLPLGNLSVVQAFSFSILISIAGVMVFGFLLNWFSAFLALGTILFYSLFYTLWLKPNTAQNIVIGGIAGSMGPVIAWAAAAGSLSAVPVLLFLIVFFWTPPHFWALALYYKDDYKEINMPMMPVVKGEDSTLTQILVYSLLLFVVTMLLAFVSFSYVYMTAAVLSGALFVQKCFITRKKKSRSRYIDLFKYSIVYLFILFAAIIFDGIVV